MSDEIQFSGVQTVLGIGIGVQGLLLFGMLGVMAQSRESKSRVMVLPELIVFSTLFGILSTIADSMRAAEYFLDETHCASLSALSNVSFTLHKLFVYLFLLYRFQLLVVGLTSTSCRKCVYMSQWAFLVFYVGLIIAGAADTKGSLSSLNGMPICGLDSKHPEEIGSAFILLDFYLEISLMVSFIRVFKGIDFDHKLYEAIRKNTVGCTAMVASTLSIVIVYIGVQSVVTEQGMLSLTSSFLHWSSIVNEVGMIYITSKFWFGTLAGGRKSVGGATAGVVSGNGDESRNG